jgi:DNA-binding beta-propeller fold protein YncE
MIRFLHVTILFLISLSVRAAVPQLQNVSLTMNGRDAVWDATRSRFFVSVSAGDPNYSASIVMVNPDTGIVEDSISTGDNPHHLAISADGQYLYVGIDAKATIRRFQLPSHSPDFDIVVGTAGSFAPVFAVLPNQPGSILVANGVTLAVFDGQVSRSQAASYPITPYEFASLYFRPGRSNVYAYFHGVVTPVSISNTGVSVGASYPAFPNWEARVTWSGGLATDDWGYVFDLDAGVLRGKIPGVLRCFSVADASGSSVFEISTDNSPGLNRYGMPALALTQSGTVDPALPAQLFVASNTGAMYLWGTDGVAIFYGGIAFLHTGALSGVPVGSPPSPETDPSGVIHLTFPPGGVVFDSQRSLIWASAKGAAGSLANNLVGVDPSSGNITATIPVGSEPGAVAITDDQQRVFAAMAGMLAIVPVNLATQIAEAAYPVSTPLTQYSTQGAFVPTALATIPGEPKSVVAISSAYIGTSYGRKVAVYDPFGPRSQTFDKLVDVLINGDGPNAFFAANESTSDLSLYRLTVTPSGILQDKQFSSIGTGFFGALAYANGYFYTDGGTMWTADTSAQVASFAGGGIPVPLPELNQVVYAWTSQTGLAIATFDLGTFRPVSSLLITEPVPDINEYPVIAAVRAGSGSIALITARELVIVPLGALQPVPNWPVTLQTIAPGVQESSIPAYAIAASRSTLIVTTPSTATNLGNSVLVMDPSTGNVVSSIFAGSEPSLIALSPDGSYAYTYLGGSGTLAGINLFSGVKDLSFSGDLNGENLPVDAWDLAVGPDGGLAVSYTGGPVAIFDRGVLRSQVDANADSFAEFGANYQLAVDPSGSLLYGYDQWVSSWGLKTWSVSQAGVTAHSLAPNLTNSYITQIRFANGLLYSSNGDVIDPVRSRDVGQFQYPGLNHLPTDNYHPNAVVYPDAAAGRVYFLFAPTFGVKELLMFDVNTYELLGSMQIPRAEFQIVNLVKWSDDGLAFNTDAGGLFFVQISAIPLISNPVIPPPVYSFPTTAGVSVLDLTVNDLAYDASRDRIYASVPASQGALADSIVTIDPGQAIVVASLPAGPNPRRLAISDDNSELYFTMGAINNAALYVSEGLRRIDLASMTMTAEFAVQAKMGGYIQTIPDLTVLPGQARSIAVISNFFGSGAVSIYDDSTVRPVAATEPYLCSSIQPGSTASRLYCYDNYTTDFALSRLAVDSNGVTLVDSSGSDLIGGFGAQILFHGGLLFTTNGKIVDPEAYQPVATVQARGLVAVDGNVAYWLDTNPSSLSSMILRAFDATIYSPLYTRVINVGTGPAIRLLPCGEGRLAFAAGNQVYIVYPN